MPGIALKSRLKIISLILAAVLLSAAAILFVYENRQQKRNLLRTIAPSQTSRQHPRHLPHNFFIDLDMSQIESISICSPQRDLQTLSSEDAADLIPLFNAVGLIGKGTHEFHEITGYQALEFLITLTDNTKVGFAANRYFYIINAQEGGHGVKGYTADENISRNFSDAYMSLFYKYFPQ